MYFFFTIINSLAISLQSFTSHHLLLLQTLLGTVFDGRKETFGTTDVENRSFCVRCNGLKDNCTKLYNRLTIAGPCTYFPSSSIFIPVLLLLLTEYYFRGIILRLTTLRQIDVVSINPLLVPGSEWVNDCTVNTRMITGQEETISGDTSNRPTNRYSCPVLAITT